MTRFSANYLNGQLEGEARYFRRNGGLKKVEQYQQGRLHGKAQCYDQKGRLKKSVYYQNGKRMKHPSPPKTKA